MKFLKYTTVLFFTMAMFVKSQQQQIAYKEQNYRSYSQFVLYLGYDMPSTEHDFKYMKYKGDVATGLTFNNFWDWIGVQAEISNAFSTIKSDLTLPLAYYNVDYDLDGSFDSYTEDYVSLKKLFLGVGPAFKYQSKNDKFVVDLGIMGGIGIPQNGAYLQNGLDEQLSSLYALNYHSGYERQSKFAMKSNLRFNYFFNPDFGAYIGGYYMNIFKAEESDKNDILIDYYYSDIQELGNIAIYNLEPEIVNVDPAIEGSNNYLANQRIVRYKGEDPNTGEIVDERKSWDLSSFGIMAGLSWKINRSKQEIRCPKGYYSCPNDGLCYLDDNCGVAPQNNIIIIAKDKTSNQALSNVEVTIINNDDKSTAGSGVTSSKGQVQVNNVANGDYTVEGKLGSQTLSNASISNKEFNDTGKIQKTIYLDNPNFTVSGKTLNCLNNQTIANAKVKAVNTSTLAETLATSDSDGIYSFSLPPANYIIEMVKEDYLSERKNLNLAQLDRSKTAETTVDVCAQKLDCNSQVKFNNLLFKLNDYHIEPGSTEELDNLAEFMQVNPNVKLEISAYTDSRGSDEYNMRLSQQRAEETVKYLVNHGVQRNRLIAKGYGETHLLNGCSNGVPCTEEEQAINRRTEFKVVCDN